MWIDSDCLSLGYLGDPAQTADRFRPNPFGSAGSRIDRSGDVGRFRPDGLLEHHGRIDDVVNRTTPMRAYGESMVTAMVVQ